MKIPSSNLGRTCCVQKLFLIFKTIFVDNMFSPCSAKRRASDKDLPVQGPINGERRSLNCLFAFYIINWSFTENDENLAKYSCDVRFRTCPGFRSSCQAWSDP